MRPRPIFYPSFGNRPDQLVGRAATIERIARGLESYPGGQERATLLVGQRGMGKTAVLLEIADRAAELGYVVARTTCGESMLDDSIELLQRNGERYVKERKAPVKGFSAGTLGFSFGLTFTEEARKSFGFRVKLEMICERLAREGKGVLLLVDEVNPALEQMRSLATAYQEIAVEEKDIAIVMAGLPNAVSDVLNYKTLTFLNRAHKVRLDPLPTESVDAYFAQAFPQAGVRIGEELRRKAARATEGSPYLLQVVGHCIVQYARDDGTVTEDVLDQALRSARATFKEDVCETTLAALSGKDIEFLRAMAEDDGSSSMADVAQRMGKSADYAQKYRKRLIDGGIVSVPRRGSVAFAVPLLADYLKA